MRGTGLAAVIALATALLLMALTAMVAEAENARHLRAVERSLADDATAKAEVVASGLEEDRVLADGLVAFVRQNPNFTEAEFETFASSQLRRHSGIRGAELAPAGEVTMVYPVAGNEGVVGTALLDHPGRSEPTRLATERRQFVLAGPHVLRQGGFGLVGIVPIFLPEPGEPLWGYALVVHDLDPLLADAGLLGVSSHAYAMRNAGDDEAFLGDDALFDARSARAELSFPGGAWELAVAPTGGWPDGSPIEQRIQAIGLSGALFVGGLTFVAVRSLGQRRDARRALRESEQRYRTVFERAPLGIVDVTTQGVLRSVSPTFAFLLGKRAASLVGTTLVQHVLPDDRAALESDLVGSQQGFSERTKREVRFVRSDGSDVWCQVDLARVEGPDGDHFLGLVEDITKRLEAQKERLVGEERRHEVERLRAIDRFKTKFLSNVSHELNTPLTPLRLQLHMLRTGGTGPLGEAQAKAVAIVDRNVARLGALVADLLDVSSMQNDRLPLQRRSVDLGALATDCVATFTAAAHDAGLTFEARLASSLLAYADADRFTQVLTNLLSNAIKFTPAGGLVAVQLQREQDRAVVRVSDTGVGLSFADRQRLFHPFSQIERHDVEHVSGTGLGLYISRAIVEQHGGALWCDSAGPGQGSTFGFWLPLAPEETQPGIAPAQTETLTEVSA